MFKYSLNLILSIFFFITTGSLVGQVNSIDVSQNTELKPVAQKIDRLSKKFKSAPIKLFKVQKSRNSKILIDTYSEYLSLVINETQLKQIINDKNEMIEVQLPSLSDPNQNITLQLYNVHLFSVNLSKKIPSNSKYFRGIIKGKSNSLVSFNITSGQVSAIISDESQNLVIQQSGLDVINYVLFNDQKLKNKKTFECHTNTNDIQIEKRSGLVTKNQKNNRTDTISLFIVCDYAMFQQNAFSSQGVVNYVSALYNEVSSIYENESIILLIDSIFIWTTQDPYNFSNAALALTSFRSQLNGNFKANFAQLLSAKPNNLGGVAFINQDCSKSKSYSFANIDGSFNYVNSYSWDIHVCAHELGHNLGSPHTHDCVWGPNKNQSLDGCYGNGSSCNPLNNLNAAGTIMSYCHLSGGGVQFALGFGTEPGNLIRSTISACSDREGFTCEFAEVLSGSGTYKTNTINLGGGAKNAPATNAHWFRYDANTNGSISIKSCLQNVDTRLYLYEGNCGQLTSKAFSDDDCNSGNGYFYSSELSNIPVRSGKTYFIEWDDRWSNLPFDFVFVVTTEANNNPCTPGTLELSGDYTSNENFQSTEQINMRGKVMNQSSVSLTSALIHLNAGTEIYEGSQFEITLGDCANN